MNYDDIANVLYHTALNAPIKDQSGIARVVATFSEMSDNPERFKLIAQTGDFRSHVRCDHCNEERYETQPLVNSHCGRYLGRQDPKARMETEYCMGMYRAVE